MFGDTLGTFVPGKGTIHLRFVMGNDGLAPIPELVARAGFRFRFAVVQDSHVEGCGEMYFDEQLWLTLLDFVKKYGANLKIIGIGPQNDFNELPIDDFLRLWSTSDPDRKTPPWSVLVSKDGFPTIGMVTENWAAVGGQQPYSDSYTYSINSHDELSEEILKHLKTANAAETWSFDFPLIRIPAHKVRAPPIAPGSFSRFLLWLRKPRKVLR